MTPWRFVRSLTGWKRLVVVPALAALVVATLLAVVWTVRHARQIERLTRGVGDTIFYTADGHPWFPMDEQRRDVPLGRIAPHLRNAVIAIEDHRFRSHAGVDVLALGRALVENLRAGELSQGGSTITQQLARTLFLSNAQSWGRKVKEAALALMIEARLSKEQILELYLNRVYLGGSTYGVEKMAQQAFGKPARDLSLAESALIAAVIQRPNALSPWSNLDAARARSHLVLRRMREEGYITAREEDEARRAPLRLRPPPREGRAEAGYARQYLREQFRALFGGDHPPGWKVYTTFDPRLQAAAERAVMRGLARLRTRGLQGALVALRPEGGAIVALVGGRDFARSEFDRATRARRQPGSAFKPFVYAAALERGFTPVTLLQQATQVPVPGTGDWTPRDASYTSGAPLALREAFIESNNRAAVGVQLAVGSRAIRGLAREAGMPDMPDVASLALGTGLVSPLQLTSAYAIFVNGGFSVEPHGIARIVDGEGEASWEMAPRPRRVLSAETAFQVISLMRDVLDRGTGSAARSLGVVFPAGGKTGTTNDGHDAWFVGFTSSLVAGVWVGHDEPRPMGPGASGARYALPIWADFMIEAARVLPAREFTPPSSLHEETLCSVSYRRATRACPAYREYFKDASEAPRELCELHRRPSLGERVSDALRGWWDRLRGIFR